MLRAGIEKILKEYKAAKKEPLAGHPLASLITKSLPAYIAKHIGSPGRYKVEGSVGKGNWAGCPWISVFDVSITDSAQAGYYPVYLFREDMAGVYLSLNQGVTDIRERYKENPKEVLKIKASDFRAQLGPLPVGFPELSIDLSTTGSNLASFYEPGNICACFYPNDALPADTELLSNLKEIMKVYKELVENDKEEGEEEIPAGTEIEDLRKFRLHKRLERRRKLAIQAKKYRGYTCEACTFNFQKVYGDIGEGFIEAHHLRSLAKHKGEVLELDPKLDFRVLCPNCHRMIHRTADPSDLEGFRKLIRK